MKTDIQFKSEGFQLAGTLYKPEGKIYGALLILGGGGNTPHKETYYPQWQDQLLKEGIASLTFDFRGVGESDMKLEETSILTRFKDAQSALDTLLLHVDKKNVYVAGISLGGPVAINLVNESKVKGLVLISPGAYSQESRDKKFGPKFSNVIRKIDSWHGSPDFEALENFKGNILLAYGALDEVVPVEILKTYADIIEKNDGQVLSFDVGHRFMRESDVNSIQFRKMFQETLSLLIIHTNNI